jgi:hypothetical protein
VVSLSSLLYTLANTSSVCEAAFCVCSSIVIPFCLSRPVLHVDHWAGAAVPRLRHRWQPIMLQLWSTRPPVEGVHEPGGQGSKRARGTNSGLDQKERAAGETVFGESIVNLCFLIPLITRAICRDLPKWFEIRFCVRTLARSAVDWGIVMPSSGGSLAADTCNTN